MVERIILMIKMKRVSLLAIPLLLFAMIVGCSSESPESPVSAEDIASIKSDLSAIKSDIADLKSASNVAALQELSLIHI